MEPEENDNEPNPTLAMMEANAKMTEVFVGLWNQLRGQMPDDVAAEATKAIFVSMSESQKRETVEVQMKLEELRARLLQDFPRPF